MEEGNLGDGEFDQVEDAVTSFGRQEVEPSPLPQSDSSHPRSHDTPEPTSSNSTSALKTVIHRQPEIKHQRAIEGDSDWDSEVSVTGHMI